MNRILVPTDFSKLSHHAVDFAAFLANQLNAEVSVVHFEDLPMEDMTLHLTGEPTKPGISDDSLFNAQLFRANKQKLRDIENEFSSDASISAKQMGGGFLKGIEHFVEKNEVDLIIIGTTGEESIQEFFSGNHTEQLIEHVKVPVLSLQHESDKNIKDVVLGLDLLDEQYSKMAFEIVKDITDGLDVHLHIINIIKGEEPETMMADLNKLARGVGLKNYVVEVVKAKNENAALMEYAENLHAGLIVTLSEARAGLARFTQHSFATRMTKLSSIPVLTINKRMLKI